MKRSSTLFVLAFTLCWTLFPHAPLQAATLRLAVASNFKHALTQVLPAFAKRHPNIDIQVSAGASGQLYAQILQGAPFDIFLSADNHYPQLLHDQGLAQPPTTYTHGRLLLITHQQATTWEDAIDHSQRIAIANPDLAPYGKAAKQLLVDTEMWPPNARLITGSNVSQVQHWFNQQHVDTAFAAASLQEAEATYASFDVTPFLTDPIQQKLTILRRSQVERTAILLVNYLQSAATQSQLAELGYVPVSLSAD